jgi:purine-nucleoside phosphorylase
MLGVEMEGAMTFALSRHFQVPSTALFYVTDNLVENETLLSAAHKAQHAARARSRSRQYDLGLELLLEDATAR